MRQYIVSGILILVAFVLSVAGYFFIGESEIASHWNIRGEADDTLPKFWGVFLSPFLMLGLCLLLFFLPRLDPLKKNVEGFKSMYHWFIVGLLGFFLYVHAVTLAWNLGFFVPVSQLILAGVGVLFFLLGGFLPHTRRNWFIGIRTPWTLSSDAVWDRTHLAGGYVFRALGIIFFVAAFLSPLYTTTILVGGSVGAALFLLAYSYYVYRQ